MISPTPTAMPRSTTSAFASSPFTFFVCQYHAAQAHPPDSRRYSGTNPLTIDTTRLIAANAPNTTVPTFDVVLGSTPTPDEAKLSGGTVPTLIAAAGSRDPMEDGIALTVFPQYGQNLNSLANCFSHSVQNNWVLPFRR